jgi:hypothetical protein
MTKFVPVMFEVRSEARKTTRIATSSGVVKRPVAKPPVPRLSADGLCRGRRRLPPVQPQPRRAHVVDQDIDPPVVIQRLLDEPHRSVGGGQVDADAGYPLDAGEP